MDWKSGLQFAGAIIVGILAFLGSQRGVRRQIEAAQNAGRRGEELEHGRRFRDRAVETYVGALDLAEANTAYRRDLRNYVGL